MPFETWLTFVVACFLISISPGAGAFAAMSSGAEYGFRRGYWTTAGLQLGLLLQILTVAIGLGALIATSHTAFTIIKWLGVLYLAYLAFRLWTKNYAETHGPDKTHHSGTPQALVRRGFMINMSNPKSIIFLLAVLPQFITLRLPLVPQYAAATATMLCMDSLVMAGFTTLGARILVIFDSLKHRILIDRIFGTIFFAIACLLALETRPG